MVEEYVGEQTFGVSSFLKLLSSASVDVRARSRRYKISNRSGVHVYQAVEETGFCWRCCCTQLRPVHMKVFDQTGTQASTHGRGL